MSVSDNLAQRAVEDWAPSMSAEKEYISDFVRLPGMWEAGDGCLDLRPTGFCEDGHIQLGSESDCGTRYCEAHWYQWRRRAAQSIVARLAAYRYVQEGIGRRMLHIVASPPQDRRWTLQEFWSMRGETYDLIEEHGGRGGAVVPHGYKPNLVARDIFGTAVERGEWDPERGIWRFLREVADDWEELRDLVEVAPHCHQLVPWEDLDGDELAAELPGDWVIHNIRSLAPFYVYEENVPVFLQLDDSGRIERSKRDVVREGFEDMARLAMYLLSHGAAQIGVGDEIACRQTVTYWGDVHPNCFDPTTELEAETWERIQRMATEAVSGGVVVVEEGEGEDDGRDCHIDDCESPVHGLHELKDFLADPAWIEGLEYDQACAVWGLKVWANDGLSPGGEMDRPPPGGFDRSATEPDEIRRDKEAFREWLRRLGRSRIHQNPWYQIEEPA